MTRLPFPRAVPLPVAGARGIPAAVAGAGAIPAAVAGAGAVPSRLTSTGQHFLEHLCQCLALLFRYVRDRHGA